MGLRIPADLQEVAKTLGLRSWIARKDFPRDDYFANIDSYRRELRKFSGGDDIGHESLATLVATTLDVEGRLIDHVLKKGTMTIASPSDWLRICEAAAWLILQAHQNAVKNGEWHESL